MQNLIRVDFLLTSIVFVLPLLALTFLAGKVRSVILLILLRVVYVPYFLLVGFAFYWFWAGDGEINLFTVPPLFLILAFFMMRAKGFGWVRALRTLDWYFFSLACAGVVTFWMIVLFYLMTGQALVIE